MAIVMLLTSTNWRSHGVGVGPLPATITRLKVREMFETFIVIPFLYVEQKKARFI